MNSIEKHGTGVARCGTRADWEELNPYDHVYVATRIVTGDGCQPYCLFEIPMPAWLKEQTLTESMSFED